MSITGALHEAIIGPISADNARNTEASVVELKDGRLLLVWSEFGAGDSDFAPAWVAGRLSADGGRTWGEKFIVQENVGQMNSFSPSLVRLQSGGLGHLYSVMNSTTDSLYYWRRSDDEGQTWSAPVLATPQPGYYVINNDRVIQLRSGRLLAPIAYVEAYSREASFRAFCHYSDDEGQTWQRGNGEIRLPGRGAMEPGVVERRDGSVLMVIRTRLGDQYRALSADGGVTWSAPRPMCLVASEAPATVKRIPRTGDLLLIWNRVFDQYRPHLGRTPLTAAISRDDGETWENIRNIEQEPDHAYAYASILFRQDEVLLTYYRSKEAFGGWELKLTILPVGWFYA